MTRAFLEGSLIIFSITIAPMVCNKLTEAVQKGKEEKVLELLMKGYDVDASNEEGITPLHAALVAENEKIVKTLIDWAAATEGPYLHMAVRKNMTDCVKWLLEDYVDVDCKDDCGETPLHYAAFFKADDEIIRLLLSFGATADAKNGLGNTPLHTALNWGTESAAYILVTGGADVNAVSCSEETPLHAAVQYVNETIVEEMLKRGAVVEATDGEGCTPLDLAVIFGSESVVKTLLTWNANPNAFNEKTSRLNTPLHLAVVHRNARMVKLLLECGARWDVADKKGYAPLHSAVKCGTYEVVRTLTDAGADVNARDSENGGCPLHYVIFNYGWGGRIADLLISKGAHVECKNSKGESPLDVVTDEMREIQDDDDVHVSLINGGAEMNVETAFYFLHKCWRSSYELAISAAYKNFDHYAIEITNAFLKARGIGVEKVPDLGTLERVYERERVFVLLRILTVTYVKREGEGPSALERIKDGIFAENMGKNVADKTYLRTLPANLVSDAFFNAGYYWWKMEKFAWNSAMASNHKRQF